MSTQTNSQTASEPAVACTDLLAGFAEHKDELVEKRLVQLRSLVRRTDDQNQEMLFLEEYIKWKNARRVQPANK